MKETIQIGMFRATDVHGNTYRIVIEQASVIIKNDRGPAREFAGRKSLRTEGGELVNALGGKRFEIIGDASIIVTSTDPDALDLNP